MAIQTGLEGKFSMEFSLASIIVLRRAGLVEYSDAVVNRPDIQETIRKIDYTVFSDEEAQELKGSIEGIRAKRQAAEPDKSCFHRRRSMAEENWSMQ